MSKELDGIHNEVTPDASTEAERSRLVMHKSPCAPSISLEAAHSNTRAPAEEVRGEIVRAQPDPSIADDPEVDAERADYSAAAKGLSKAIDESITNDILAEMRRRDAQSEAIKQNTRELLRLLGYDLEAPGLAETPRRVAKMWMDFAHYQPGTTDTAFEQVKADQMVVVAGMKVWSMCEHHLLPFWCSISIGYVARGKVLGLSKFARIAHEFAHKLQLQERLVEQIATRVIEVTGTEDVAVHAVGEHLCMTMRGIRTPALMHSSSLNGCFRERPEARAEFYSLAGVGRAG